ncbi:SSI family serine proteinase inhibitor [Streptomyces fagopyri]|uniref:SSI family serine proteinase inhibitor n=1 Tax=Streptomyces fagopyri TaxID=2662397 RepID=UPI003716A51C
MTRTTEALRGALLTAAALLTTAAVPAPATSQQAVPGNWLHLTVTPGEVSPQVLPPLRAPGRAALRAPAQGFVRVPVRDTLGVPPGATPRESPDSPPPGFRRAPFRTEGTPGSGTPGSGTPGSGTPGTRGALLFCDPPQGHPHAVRACAELNAAEGDIDRIPDTPGTLCPMIYAPVTAAARGEWNGRPVTYTHTFANSCVMGAATGAVFALE